MVPLQAGSIRLTQRGMLETVLTELLLDDLEDFLLIELLG